MSSPSIGSQIQAVEQLITSRSAASTGAIVSEVEVAQVSEVGEVCAVSVGSTSGREVRLLSGRAGGFSSSVRASLHESGSGDKLALGCAVSDAEDPMRASATAAEGRAVLAQVARAHEAGNVMSAADLPAGGVRVKGGGDVLRSTASTSLWSRVGSAALGVFSWRRDSKAKAIPKIDDAHLSELVEAIDFDWGSYLSDELFSSLCAPIEAAVQARFIEEVRERPSADVLIAYRAQVAERLQRLLWRRAWSSFQRELSERATEDAFWQEHPLVTSDWIQSELVKMIIDSNPARWEGVEVEEIGVYRESIAMLVKLALETRNYHWGKPLKRECGDSLRSRLSITETLASRIADREFPQGTRIVWGKALFIVQHLFIGGGAFVYMLQRSMIRAESPGEGRGSAIERFAPEVVLACRGTAMRRGATEGLYSGINDIDCEPGTRGVRAIYPELSATLDRLQKGFGRTLIVDIYGKSLGGAMACHLCALLMVGLPRVRVRSLTTLAAIGSRGSMDLFKRAVLTPGVHCPEIFVVRIEGDYVPLVAGAHLGAGLPRELDVCVRLVYLRCQGTGHDPHRQVAPLIWMTRRKHPYYFGVVRYPLDMSDDRSAIHAQPLALASAATSTASEVARSLESTGEDSTPALSLSRPIGVCEAGGGESAQEELAGPLHRELVGELEADVEGKSDHTLSGETLGATAVAHPVAECVRMVATGRAALQPLSSSSISSGLQRHHGPRLDSSLRTLSVISSAIAPREEGSEDLSKGEEAESSSEESKDEEHSTADEFKAFLAMQRASEAGVDTTDADTEGEFFRQVYSPEPSKDLMRGFYIGSKEGLGATTSDEASRTQEDAQVDEIGERSTGQAAPELEGRSAAKRWHFRAPPSEHDVLERIGAARFEVIDPLKETITSKVFRTYAQTVESLEMMRLFSYTLSKVHTLQATLTPDFNFAEITDHEVLELELHVGESLESLRHPVSYGIGLFTRGDTNPLKYEEAFAYRIFRAS